jgi:hypothetical protein
MINKFSVNGDTVEMVVSDKLVLFDLEDFPKLDRFNQWKLSRSKSIVTDYRKGKEMMRITLHYLLTGCRFVKWIDGNVYDFRKINMEKAKAPCHHVAGEKIRKGNEYRVENGTVVLFMESKGTKYEALIDCEDYLIMREHTWNRNPATGYVQSMTREGRAGTKHVYLHRVILGIDDSTNTVDHINGNKLDNRKCNLRVCSLSQNHHNKEIHRKGTAGVSATRYGWEAHMMVNHILHRKQFKSFDDAVDQYRAWEKEFNPSGLKR